MSESVQSTFEEASRCPKCGKPGEDRKVSKPQDARLRREGATIHLIYCVTPLCPWEGTPWSVQVNKDGSVPPPSNHTGQPKVYEGFADHDTIATRIVDGIRRETELQQKPGAEIRRPR